MKYQNISIIGLGYIGLPTAAMFASKKINVLGVDINENAVKTVNEGKIHIVEPGLEELVSEAVKNGNLRASTVPEESDAFLIAVPTPFKSESASGVPEPDLSYIKSACEAISPFIKKGNLVVLESTSPVGATEQMASWLSDLRPDLTFPHNEYDIPDVNIAHCPERVLPGHVIRELVENDRIIGGMTPVCSEKSVVLYKTFVEGECVVTNARTAPFLIMKKAIDRALKNTFSKYLPKM